MISGSTTSRSTERAALLEYASLAAYADSNTRFVARPDNADALGAYRSLARTARGPVLEYGAGYGRVTLALARRGASVVAVERSRPMLDELERRTRNESVSVRRRVKAVWGDMRSLSLKQRFSLVTAPGGVMQHLYGSSAFDGFFQQLKRHLRPGGTFAFDVPSPDLDVLAKQSRRGDYDFVQQIAWYKFRGQRREIVPFALRQYFPNELAALLERYGFGSVRVRAYTFAEQARLFVIAKR